MASQQLRDEVERRPALADELTVGDLRRILAEEIQSLRAGDTSAANVNAVTNATGKILSTVKLQMEYYRLIGKTPEIPLLMASEKKAP